MVSKRTAITICLVLLVVLAASTYSIFVPQFVSYQHKRTIQAAATPLKDSFKALNKSTELPLITSEPAPEEVKKDNAKQISQLIATTRQQVAELKRASASFTTLPYSDVLGQYGSIHSLETRAKSLIGQTEDTVNSYEQLYKYLEVFNKSVDAVSGELNGFNVVTDINIYGGQDEQVRQIAVKIRDSASVLSGVTAPEDMRALNNRTISSFNEAAAGFDDLADGLMIPADDPIYTATKRIEKATTELDSVKGAIYEDSFNHSRALKNIQDLGDKVELVLGQ